MIIRSLDTQINLNGLFPPPPKQLIWSTQRNYTLRPCLVRKIFQDSPSHQILRHMHGALNINENKNYLHSSSVNREMNLLSLVTL